MLIEKIQNNNAFSTISKAREISFIAHDIDCNHWYDKDKNLRYSYHLQLVADFTSIFSKHHTIERQIRAICVAYLHDIIEDARFTYNDVERIFGKSIADSVYNLTNFKGRSRSERACDKYYEDVNNDDIAVIVKYADRFANISHAFNEVLRLDLHLHQQAIQQNKMLKGYLKEHYEFCNRLDNSIADLARTSLNQLVLQITQILEKN